MDTALPICYSPGAGQVPLAQHTREKTAVLAVARFRDRPSGSIPEVFLSGTSVWSLAWSVLRRYLNNSTRSVVRGVRGQGT